MSERLESGINVTIDNISRFMSLLRGPNDGGNGGDITGEVP
jgi:hypothetical protein